MFKEARVELIYYKENGCFLSANAVEILESALNLAEKTREVNNRLNGLVNEIGGLAPHDITAVSVGEIFIKWRKRT